MAIKPTATLRIDLVEGEDETVIMERTNTEGEVTSILLTHNDIAHLARNMSQFAARLLTHSQKELLAKDPDLQPHVALPVKSGYANVDLHGSLVILGIQDEMDQWSHYSLTPKFARVMAGQLEKYAEQVEQSPKTDH